MGVATKYNVPAGYCWPPAAAAAAWSRGETGVVVTTKSVGDEGEARALAHLTRHGLALVQ
jgi:hypothetical protein